MPIIMGLTAPFQHGKTELRPVIESMGWKFVDVNDFQNRLRLPGSQRYALYNRLMPGSLDDEGGETVEYYRNITPRIRQQLLPAELPLVAQAVRDYIMGRDRKDKVILSWELWPKVLNVVQPHHMVVFTQPQKVWLRKLRKRIIERGWHDWLPGNEEIARLIRTMDAVPTNILAAVKAAMPRAYTAVDVSPADWNATGVIAALNRLEKLPRGRIR